MRLWAHMIKYMLLNILIHQGAQPQSSQTSPPQQAFSHIDCCAQYISWSTTVIAKLVTTTNSWKRSSNIAWQCNTALKTAMTQAPSFSLTSCHTAAAMFRIWRNGVAHATKLWRSEIKWHKWLELCSFFCLGTYVCSTACSMPLLRWICHHVWPFHIWDTCVYRKKVQHMWTPRDLHACQWHPGLDIVVQSPLQGMCFSWCASSTLAPSQAVVFFFITKDCPCCVLCKCWMEHFHILQ